MTFGEWMGVIVLKNGGPKISIQQWRRSDVMSPHTNETLLIKHNLKHKGGDVEGGGGEHPAPPYQEYEN